MEVGEPTPIRTAFAVMVTAGQVQVTINRGIVQVRPSAQQDIAEQARQIQAAFAQKLPRHDSPWPAHDARLPIHHSNTRLQLALRHASRAHRVANARRHGCMSPAVLVPRMWEMAVCERSPAGPLQARAHIRAFSAGKGARRDEHPWSCTFRLALRARANVCT